MRMEARDVMYRDIGFVVCTPDFKRLGPIVKPGIDLAVHYNGDTGVSKEGQIVLTAKIMAYDSKTGELLADGDPRMSEMDLNYLELYDGPIMVAVVTGERNRVIFGQDVTNGQTLTFDVNTEIMLRSA